MAEPENPAFHKSGVLLWLKKVIEVLVQNMNCKGLAQIVKASKGHSRPFVVTGQREKGVLSGYVLNALPKSRFMLMTVQPPAGQDSENNLKQPSVER